MRCCCINQLYNGLVVDCGGWNLSRIRNPRKNGIITWRYVCNASKPPQIQLHYICLVKTAFDAGRLHYPYNQNRVQIQVWLALKWPSSWATIFVGRKSCHKVRSLPGGWIHSESHHPVAILQSYLPFAWGFVWKDYFYRLGTGNSNIFYVHPYLGEMIQTWLDYIIFFRWVGWFETTK